MNPLYVCGLLVCVVAAVSCEELCSPDQWEGVEVSNGGYVYRHSPGYIEEFNYIHYDAKNMRKAATVEYNNNGNKMKLQTLSLYSSENEGVVYIANAAEKTCQSRKVTMPFRKACVPSDKKVDAYALGLKSGGMNVTGYYIEKKDTSAYIAVATAGKFIIPVFERVHGKFSGAFFSQNIQYADITPGIKDDSVFDIPAECKDKVLEETVTDYMMREHHFFGI